jgi:NTP pyrophosphatase (non-canonical NTP hydrolase)
MDVQELSARAVRVRELYERLNKKRGDTEWSVLDRMGGLVGDMGDLMKIVQAKEGLRTMDGVDAALGHELADCLWCLLVVADHYGVDLEKEFLGTMEMLGSAIEKKLE